ncbi:tryptophan synthase alpha chain [Serratia symbiotica str. 'Cinara cedri']|uniref:Tryptophan synthase alpha chain n=1 Tax=Serratia symbiotica TaxID=138074 RepID=B4YQR7_9GAMM|nr:tryptophan synthase alpha unit [Serratia symbiotica]AEW44532.1 tryptophan synthase alpha chain [Serratia symbiotica str. 'Cinara cedri']
MDRYQTLFKRLENNKEGAFVPFVMLGDPDQDLSLKIIDTLIESGADALELGIPFSDPLADGPEIQGASMRALVTGATPDHSFELLILIRQKYPDIPIGLLVYANLVFNNGIDVFYQRCANVDIDSVLIADVPFEESAPFRVDAVRNSIASIFICPPNADDDLLHKISLYGGGYTYLLSRAGVTGTEIRGQLPRRSLINKLRAYHAPPPLQGFGISDSSQINGALQAGAVGVILGSAIVKIIRQNQADPVQMLVKLADFVRTMKYATL